LLLALDARLRVLGYIRGMTKERVKELLDRVLTWPPERQADVAQVVEFMEAQDNQSLGLGEERGGRGSAPACSSKSDPGFRRGRFRPAARVTL
jgi:hypothetical protein